MQTSHLVGRLSAFDCSYFWAIMVSFVSMFDVNDCQLYLSREALCCLSCSAIVVILGRGPTFTVFGCFEAVPALSTPQRRVPDQDVAQGSYIALPLTLLLLLAAYNHEKVKRPHS